MKALKLSVILMGVLIVVGLAVVVITVTRRAGHPDAPQAASGVSPPVAGAPAIGAPPAFGPVTLNYPQGFEPVETIADGDRLIVRFQSPQSGAGRVVVLDLRTGRVLGTVTLAPEAR